MVPDLVDPWQDIEFSNNKNKIMIEVSTHTQFLPFQPSKKNGGDFRIADDRWRR